ncbi:MAG: hypothetical protein HRF51_12795 [bacterium]|jgi:hypothetical protein
MRIGTFITLTLCALCLAIVGCQKAMPTLANSDRSLESADQEFNELFAASSLTADFPAPAPLVDVAFDDKALRFWPYTGDDFSGQPQDPVNLIFVGQADPRDIRAALMSLDGDRSAFGFPPAAPFNATWDDAIGDVQTGYAENVGWLGGVVQLACGDYGPARFHLRLFKAGEWTIGNAHFEILIPGTTDHQVINWELAEQLVIADFIRSGLLDPNIPMIPVGSINDAPFRTIPAIIYNGLPVELRAAIGGPLGDASEDVPIGTDGQALILNLTQKVTRASEVRTQDFVIDFNQTIPKPFCASSAYDYLYVQGPVHLTQTVEWIESGRYKFRFFAGGTLTAIPVNPLTGEPTGAPMQAEVREMHSGYMVGTRWEALGSKYQKLGLSTEPNSGKLFSRLVVRSSGVNGFLEEVRCYDSDWQPVSSKLGAAGPTGATCEAF